MPQPTGAIVTVGLNSTNTAVTVNPTTITVTPQGNQGITWTVPSIAPAGWTISSITISPNGSNSWVGTPASVQNMQGFTWTVPDLGGNPTVLFTYTLWMSNSTSTLSIDPEILNTPPGGW